MIILNSTTQTLAATLGGTPSTDQPDVAVFYRDLRAEDAREGYGSQLSETTGTSVKTILDAPRAGVVRLIDEISIVNLDTSSATVQIELYDGATPRTLYKVTLATLESAIYNTNTGWVCFTTAGAIK